MLQFKYAVIFLSLATGQPITDAAPKCGFETYELAAEAAFAVKDYFPGAYGAPRTEQDAGCPSDARPSWSSAYPYASPR